MNQVIDVQYGQRSEFSQFENDSIFVVECWFQFLFCYIEWVILRDNLFIDINRLNSCVGQFFGIQIYGFVIIFVCEFSIVMQDR